MRGISVASILRSMTSALWMPSGPGYSAMRRSSMPPALPVNKACSEKPVVVTTTQGMPAFSVSVAGRAAAGAQLPQAPLPEINACTPFSFAILATSCARSRCSFGLSPPA